MSGTAVIYYFSGTGNSWRLAETAAAGFRRRGYECFLSPVERGEMHPMHGGAEYVGFVSCVLGFGLPQMVARFMRNLPRGIGQRAFVLISIGSTEPVRMGRLETAPVPGFEGVCIYQARRLLAGRGYELLGAGAVEMPHNWILVGEPPGAGRVESLGLAADDAVDGLVDGVLTGTGEVKLANPLLAGAAGLVYLAFLLIGRRVMGVSFIAAERCDGCGVCARDCPSGTIRMQGGRPSWKLDCQQCFRCIHLCPRVAIEVSGTALALVQGAATGFSLARIPSRLVTGVNDGAPRKPLRVAWGLVDTACGLYAASLLLRALTGNARARTRVPWLPLTSNRTRYRQPGYRPGRRDPAGGP